MYFKPRIFISSTFDLLKIRDQVKQFFDSVGSETMLYEANLTPSMKPSTYRFDIQEADFVIFIFDERYGSKTDTGKSGTHEEWTIVSNTQIPKHVYVKDSPQKDEELQKFISEEINKKYVSFYFYKDDADLLAHIKQMTFTIARDISLHKVSQAKLEESVVRKLSVTCDYNKALELIRVMEEVRQLHNKSFGGVDFISTTVISDIIDPWVMYYRDNDKRLFIDSELNRKFEIMLDQYRHFYECHIKNFTGSGSTSHVFLKSYNLEISISALHCYNNEYQPEELDRHLNDFLKSYADFKNFALAIKSDLDIYYFG
jgi:hypothetical protein